MMTSAAIPPSDFFTTARPKRPYPGLRPFESEEWSIFFGRERMVDEVVDRLAAHRLVLIHGASGAGKSSLVRAGVLPKLARQHLRHGAPWLTCSIRPSGGPLWNLAREFARLEGRPDDLARVGAIVRLFNRNGATLSTIARSLDLPGGQHGDQRFCILVDQFEELFRFAKEMSRPEADLFVDLLRRQVDRRDGDPPEHGDDAPPQATVHVVVTMRSEFLGECTRFEGLAEAINRSQYLVPRMDRDGLLRAIRRPALLYGGQVSLELAERLITDVAGRDDELPLIQHGLMFLWDEAVAAARSGQIVLDAAPLDRAGGLANLLSDYADAVMAKVAPDAAGQKTIEKLLRALTDINAEGQAIRRPQAFRDLVAVTGVSPGTLRDIVDAFRAEGVSFLTPYAPAAIDGGTFIDISHEALIRCWRRVADPRTGWLKQEFEDGLLWRSLVFEAKGFEANRRRILSAATIDERKGWFAERTERWSERYGGHWALVGRLVDASARARNRASRLRKIAMFSAAFALLALTAGAVTRSILAARQATEAQRDATEAQREATLRDQALSNVNAGDQRVAQGDLAGALAAYRQSLEVADRLAQSKPGDDRSNPDLAAAYDRIGSVQLAQGDLAGALASYRASFSVRSGLAKADPGNVGTQRDLAVSYNKIGDVLVAQGDLMGGLESYRGSLAIARRLMASDPANAAGQRDLAVSNSKIGNVLVARGDLVGALASYSESLALSSRLASLDPGNLDWTHDVSVSHERIGDVQAALGNPVAALASYRIGLSIAETLADKAPDRAEWQRDLSIAYAKIASVMKTTGQKREALDALRQGRAILARITSLSSSNPSWSRDLAWFDDQITELTR
jgi:tetratricopeptide (TPR) repeat protein